MPTYSELAKPGVRTQPVYEPGRPTEVVARELGLDPATIIKLASNENPLGPSPRALKAGQEAMRSAHLYPENSSYFLKRALAERFGLEPSAFITGHGSNEIISLLCAAFVGPGTEVVMGAHAFISYKLATLLHGGKPVEVPLTGLTHDLPAMRSAITENTRLVFLPSPNNPTGTANDAADIEAFANDLPDHVVFAFDGAYQEYLDQPADLRPAIAAGKKVICLQTFSKIHGLAALRVGYAYADPELIGLLERIRAPFNVNAIGQAAALAALADDDHVAMSRRVNADGLAQVTAGCADLGLETVPSQGNFILIRFGDAAPAFSALQANGVITRPVGGYGLPEYLRVSIGTGEENERFLEACATLNLGTVQAT